MRECPHPKRTSPTFIHPAPNHNGGPDVMSYLADAPTHILFLQNNVHVFAPVRTILVMNPVAIAAHRDRRIRPRPHWLPRCSHIRSRILLLYRYRCPAMVTIARARFRQPTLTNRHCQIRRILKFAVLSVMSHVIRSHMKPYCLSPEASSTFETTFYVIRIRRTTPDGIWRGTTNPYHVDGSFKSRKRIASVNPVRSSAPLDHPFGPLMVLNHFLSSSLSTSSS